jgi:hypothetical protein
MQLFSSLKYQMNDRERAIWAIDPPKNRCVSRYDRLTILSNSNMIFYKDTAFLLKIGILF